MGEFLGIFSGDGSFYKSKGCHYSVRIYTGSYEIGYIQYLNKKLIKWFNKKPHIYYTKYKNSFSATIFHYDSKVIYLLLKEYLNWENKKTYSIRLKDLKLEDKEFNLGFLRGLIDTDGNYYHPKRRLSFSTTSKELYLQVDKIIKYNLDMSPNFHIYKKVNRSDLYTVSLHVEKARKAITLIKPNNPNKTVQ